MSSTLPAFFMTLDVSALIGSNIHSILVGVNHIGMDREHPETFHHLDRSLQHTVKDLQYNSAQSPSVPSID